jgi:hypothetical protein
MTVITAHAEVTDLGRWAEGLRGLAQWLADGRPASIADSSFTSRAPYAAATSSGVIGKRAIEGGAPESRASRSSGAIE